MSENFTSATILLPLINETYSLRQTVDEVLEVCAPGDLREFLIVVCERTTPEAMAVAQQIFEEKKGGVEVVIHHQQAPFIGGAMRETFYMSRGSHVIMMSTDLETDPKLAATFIAEARRAPEQIITASRWIKGGGFSGYNPVKYVANFFFQKIISLLFWARLTDATYGYRIFPTALVKRIKWEEAKHPFFLETALKPLRLGTKIREVPVFWNCRTEGESQNSFFKNFAYFKTAFRIRFMKKEDILRRDA